MRFITKASPHEPNFAVRATAVIAKGKDGRYEVYNEVFDKNKTTFFGFLRDNGSLGFTTLMGATSAVFCAGLAAYGVAVYQRLGNSLTEDLLLIVGGFVVSAATVLSTKENIALLDRNLESFAIYLRRPDMAKPQSG